MSEVILGIGGNTGNRLKNLLLAGGLLSEKIGCLTSYSPIVESEPWGFKSENWFLNQILVFETNLDPNKILKICLEVEKVLGRKRTGVYSDRLMDIDILFYDNLVLQEKDLTLPHPRLHERLFILKPLEKLRPELLHPVSGKSVKEMLRECNDPTITRWLQTDHSTVLLP